MADDIGTLLRTWRQRRRMSQLALASEAAVSTRHLSYVETGRARPSRTMVLHLAEQLHIPLRDRNLLLVAAGYAPTYDDRPLDAPALGDVRNVLDRILAGHEPYPAFVVERDWTIVTANPAAWWLVRDVAPELLEPPINALRVTLHPGGLAPAITNLSELRTAVLAHVARDAAHTADPALAALYEELRSYPGGDHGHGGHSSGDLAHDRSGGQAGEPHPGDGIVVPVRLRRDGTDLSFISTLTSFARALNVAVSELAIEALFPADDTTASVLQRRATEGAPVGS